MELDWSASMQQTFEFFKINPNTWRDDSKLENITGASITIDSEDSTFTHATLDGSNLVGEFYVRIYLVATQNHMSYRIPLGTFLVQTNTIKYNGKVQTSSVDAYSSLIELKEKKVPIGLYVEYTANVMDSVIQYVKENARAPIYQKDLSSKTIQDLKGFVAEFDDDWLTFITDLISTIGFHFEVNPNGEIMFAPDPDKESQQPIWTYTDDNSSILYPEVSTDEDLYGIPNVVEVLYTSESESYLGVATNDDLNSPISVQNRGRKIIHRETAPESTVMTRDQVDDYAKKILKDLSSIECTLSYQHGYCPVRVGDCVLFNYERSGFKNIKAVVKSQTISCEEGCPVTETATFTKKLWG